MVSSKKSQENQPTITVGDLGRELQFSVDEVAGILSTLGMENPVESSVIPPRLVIAAKAAIASIQSKKSNVISLPQALDKPPAVPVSAIEELPKSDIKQIANSVGLSQKVIREIDLMLVARELQIAFVEGFQQVQLEKELREAKESGKVAAQLLELKERENAIATQEAQLLELSKERAEASKSVSLANNLGIDLEQLLTDFEKSTKPQGEGKKSALWELVQARLAS